MRTLMYYVACSVDGFIAHKDGTFEGFLPEGEHVQDFLDSYEWFDVVLMGRKTYDVGLKEGVTNPYPTLESYVFSRSMKESPDPVVTLVSGNLVEVVRDLRSQDGKAIWLCGGADLAPSSLAPVWSTSWCSRSIPFSWARGSRSSQVSSSRVPSSSSRARITTTACCS
jgi:dihydrofolate reductase